MANGKIKINCHVGSTPRSTEHTRGSNGKDFGVVRRAVWQRRVSGGAAVNVALGRYTPNCVRWWSACRSISPPHCSRLRSPNAGCGWKSKPRRPASATLCT